MDPAIVIEDDDVTFRNDDGSVALNLLRLSGRPKVYVQSPKMGTTSLDPSEVRAFAAWLLDTIEPPPDMAEPAG